MSASLPAFSANHSLSGSTGQSLPCYTKLEVGSKLQLQPALGMRA